MRNEIIESLTMLGARLSFEITSQKPLLNGHQLTIRQNNDNVHLTIFNNGNYLVQGKDGRLKDIIEIWSNKKKEGPHYGYPDYNASWREWNQDANIVADYIKENGLPEESTAPHNYKIHREVMFHDFMFRNSYFQKLNFQKIDLIVRSWLRRFCFMNLEVNKLLIDIKNYIFRAGYHDVTEDNIPFAIAVESIAYNFSGHCPHKFIQCGKSAVCPQVKAEHYSCVTELIDNLYIYCEEQKVLAYTKSNLHNLLKRETSKLTWHSLAPSTPIEEKMSEGLLNAGILNFPQFQAYSPEHKYRIDFVIKTSNGLSIAIECDGLQFHANASTYIRDRVRDRYLQRRGFHIMRFSSVEIFNNLNDCIKEIDETFWMIQKDKLSFKTNRKLGYFGVLDDD